MASMFMVNGARARRAGAVKKMDAGVRGQMAVGDGRAFMIAGHQVDRHAAVGDLFERLKGHFDQAGRHLAAVQNIAAVDNGLYLPLQRRRQGSLKIGEKVRAPSAPFDARAKGQVETQVGVSDQQDTD
jgi:hypothetical protein